MIRLFGINDIDFRSNGERIIRARKAEVYRDIDGEYKLYLQAPLEERIENNSIIVAPTPWGEQPFRVYTVESGMYSRTIYARHIFFDAMNYLLDDVAPTDKDAKDALEWILARTDVPNNFTADSDIEVIKSTRHVNKSLYDAVHDLAKAYGGYVVPDGLQIGIYSSLGADKGVTIRYGKNLKGISATENWDNVCTKLLPIGHEGIELPEKYVEADVQYDIPYSRTIRFNPSTGIDVTDEEAVIEDLRAQAEEYVEANKYPQVNYTVEAFEQAVDLGDTIHVLHDKAGIDILTTVISITYDCIRQQAIRIEFGNFRPSIKGLAKTINETQKSVETERVERITKTTALEKALEQSEKTIMDYLTKGHKYITENAIYFLDNQDPSLAEHVMMMSLGGIAFGEQGINGPFTTAWDIEGNFNAQFITSGTMSADRVRTGKILSADGKLQIDLDDGEIRIGSAGKTIEEEIAQAQENAEAYALAQAELAKTEAEAYADGIVTAEEQARIADVQAKLQQAKQYADNVVDAFAETVYTKGEVDAQLTVTSNSILSTVAGTYVTKDYADETLATADKVSQVEQTVDGILSTVTSIQTDVTDLDTRLTTAELAITADAIVSTVRQSQEYLADLNAKASTTALSQVEQTANKISWLVTGNSQAEMELTEEALTVIADEINLQGKVKASWLNITDFSEVNSTLSGWSLTPSAIYKNSATFGASGGMYFGTSGLSITDKFKVTSAGALTATSAIIKGDITATSFTCVDSNENFIGGIIQDEHGNSVLAARMLVDPDNIASVFVGSWSSGEMSVPAGVKMSTSNKVFFEANDYFTRLKASGGTAFITISAAHSNSANIVLNAELPTVYMQVSSGENEKSRFELSPMLTRLITQDGIPIDISSVSGSYNGNMTLSSSNITLSVENTSTSGGSITLQYHSRDLLATAAYIKVNPTNIELYGLGGVNVSGALIPSSGGFYNLGTSEYRWNYLYATYLNISGSSTFSGSVSISGTTTLSNSLTARNIYFAADNTYEIGSSSVRPSWVRCVYLAVRTYISGTTAITGNFRPYQGYSPTLGTTDYVWDTIYCNKIGTTLIPNTVGAWDLGNSSLRFRTIYATNPLNTSDIRIKSDIREVKGNVGSQKQNMQKLLSTELQITDADIIDFIEKLNVYTYVLKKPKVTYKEVEKAVGDNDVDIDKVPEVEFLDQTVSDALADNRMEDIQLGLLANELENHVLYPYIGYKDTINNEKHLALKYNGLTVAALKAIQILLKRINSLENKIQ